MIIVMEPNAPVEAIESVIQQLTSSGQVVQRVVGTSRTMLAVLGPEPVREHELWKDRPYVEEVLRVNEPFHLASRAFRRSSTVASGAWGNIGGDKPWLAVEPVGFAQVADIPHDIAAGRPFDAAVARNTSGPKNVGALVCLSLERDPGGNHDVVFVHRVPSWGVDALIGAAERFLADGRSAVVLLEAGGEYPNGARTLEIAAIARAKLRTHLPLVVDASTIAQRTRYVPAVAQAAIAAGADGVVVRAWAGRDDEMPTMPATLQWRDAVALGERLRAIAAAARG